MILWIFTNTIKTLVEQLNNAKHIMNGCPQGMTDIVVKKSVNSEFFLLSTYNIHIYMQYNLYRVIIKDRAWINVHNCILYFFTNNSCCDILRKYCKDTVDSVELV